MKIRAAVFQISDSGRKLQIVVCNIDIRWREGGHWCGPRLNLRLRKNHFPMLLSYDHNIYSSYVHPKTLHSFGGLFDAVTPSVPVQQYLSIVRLHAYYNEYILYDKNSNEDVVLVLLWLYHQFPAEAYNSFTHILQGIVPAPVKLPMRIGVKLTNCKPGAPFTNMA